MKNSKKIKSLMKKIKEEAECWLNYVNSMNEMAMTDRILEVIIKDAQELEKLQEERFNSKQLRLSQAFSFAPPRSNSSWNSNTSATAPWTIFWMIVLPYMVNTTGLRYELKEYINQSIHIISMI